MAGHDITKMLQPTSGKAHIEAFFTRKGKDLYCIVPGYQAQLRIKNMAAKPSTRVSVLGTAKKFRWQQAGKDGLIDLSSLRPGDVTADAFVIKLENVL